MTRNLSIVFERSGGFTGISMNAGINIESLPEQEASDLLIMISNARLDELPAPGGKESSFPDMFSYKLIIKKDDKVYSYDFQEKDIDPSIQPLIKYLTSKAIDQKRRNQ